MITTNAWICILRTDLFDFAVKKGIYGGVQSTNLNRDMSSLSHIMCMKKGDLVFIYRRVTKKGERKLYGVFEVTKTGVYDNTRLWTGGLFPYRVFIRPHSTYGFLPEGMDHLDMLGLIDKGVLWNMRSPAMERRGTKKSVHKITIAEANYLIRIFRNINASKTPITRRSNPYNPIGKQRLITRFLRYLQSLRGNNVPAENVLEAWLMYKFLLRSPSIIKIFGKYEEFLAEVPVFISEPGNQVDILLTHEDNNYTVIELKKDELRKVKNGELKKNMVKELEKIKKYRKSIADKRCTGNIQKVKCVLLGKAIATPFNGTLPNGFKLVEYSIQHNNIILSIV